MLALELELRKFILQAFASFQDILRLGANPSTEDKLRISRFQRGRLLDWTENATNNLTAADIEIAFELIENLRHIEKSWHICEVFCFNSASISINLGFIQWLKVISTIDAR